MLQALGFRLSESQNPVWKTTKTHEKPLVQSSTPGQNNAAENGNTRLTQEGTVAEKPGKWKRTPTYANERPKSAVQRCQTELRIGPVPLTRNDKR